MLLCSFHLNLKIFDVLIQYPVLIDYKHSLICPEWVHQLIVKKTSSKSVQRFANGAPRRLYWGVKAVIKQTLHHP